MLAGAEVGRQLTDNFRNTGFFNNTSTSILVPLSASAITTPVTWRQSATDANNHLVTNVAAGYVQDQVELSKYVQLIGGIRSIISTCGITTIAPARNLQRADKLVSPRARDCGEAAERPLDLRPATVFLLAQLGRPVLVANHHHAAGEAGEVQQLRGRREVGRSSAALTDHSGVPPEP